MIITLYNKIFFFFLSWPLSDWGDYIIEEVISVKKVIQFKIDMSTSFL